MNPENQKTIQTIIKEICEKLSFEHTSLLIGSKNDLYIDLYFKDTSGLLKKIERNLKTAGCDYKRDEIHENAIAVSGFRIFVFESKEDNQVLGIGA